MDKQVMVYQLDKRVDQGLIRRAHHPTLPLTIYSYTPECQFSGAWDKYTLMARGLILDRSGSIVAKPFSKFFNYGEKHCPDLPTDLPFDIFEKIDGCFGRNTRLNLWEGGTITIGEVVEGRLTPILVGFKNGKPVPAQVINWFENGRKEKWCRLKISSSADSLLGDGQHGSVIQVTPNHSVYANGRYVSVCHVEVGDSIASFETALDEKGVHLINSFLLGDGSLCKTAGKEKGAFKFQIGHKMGHRQYDETILSWLGDFGISIREIVSGYGSSISVVTSRTLRSLRDIRSEWYPDGKKKVPSDLEWMDDFSVAIWYMDDGSLSHTDLQQDRACFHTHSFTKQDVQRLADRLIFMYGIDARIQETSKGCFIRINAGRDSSIDKFWTRIAPHVVPCMRYKLPVQYRNIDYSAHFPISLVKRQITGVVQSLEFFDSVGPKPRMAFDIKTTTANYHAQGMLVHNSLGIYFNYEDKWHVSTRGSFDNQFVEYGSQFLHFMNGYQKHHTICTEICMPRDMDGLERAVLHAPGLYLLGAVDLYSGKDMDYGRMFEEWPGFLPRVFTGSVEALNELAKTKTDTEGWVIRWQNGFRIKIKTAWYYRLFRVICRLEESVRDGMLKGVSKRDILKDVPEELKSEAEAVFNQIRKYTLEREHYLLGETVANWQDEKKDFALRIQNHPDKSYMFRIYEDKDITESLIEEAPVSRT